MNRKLARLLTAVTAAVAVLPIGTASAAPGDFNLDFDFSAARPGTYDADTGAGASPADTVESLEPFEFECGDLVVFFAEIEVVADPEDGDDQSLTFLHSFMQETTSGSQVGFDDMLEDATIVDATGALTGAATATIADQQVVNDPPPPGPALDTEVLVEDLDAGEHVWLRLDIRLVCEAGETNVTGTIQAALEDVLQGDDNLQAGRQTIPLDLEGVIPPPPPGQGQITVAKVARGYRVFDFEFEFTGGTTPFELEGGSQLTFGPLDPGTFSVTEDADIDGFVLTDIDCTGTDPENITIGDDGDFDPGDVTVTIELEAGDDVLCTFTNTRTIDIPNTSPVINLQQPAQQPTTETLNDNLVDSPAPGAPVSDPAVDGERLAAVAELPRTGISTGFLAAFGLAALVSGAATLRLRRRGGHPTA